LPCPGAGSGTGFRHRKHVLCQFGIRLGLAWFIAPFRCRAPMKGEGGWYTLARPIRGIRRSGSSALLICRNAVEDFLLGGFGAVPAQHLDPLAFFEVLVVLEEVFDG